MARRSSRPIWLVDSESAPFRTTSRLRGSPVIPPAVSSPAASDCMRIHTNTTSADAEDRRDRRAPADEDVAQAVFDRQCHFRAGRDAAAVLFTWAWWRRRRGSRGLEHFAGPSFARFGSLLQRLLQRVHLIRGQRLARGLHHPVLEVLLLLEPSVSRAASSFSALRMAVGSFLFGSNGLAGDFFRSSLRSRIKFSFWVFRSGVPAELNCFCELTDRRPSLHGLLILVVLRRSPRRPASP